MSRTSLLAASAIAGVLAWTINAAQAQDVITLGAAVSLTGKYTTNGEHTQRGYDLAADMINKAGDGAGRPPAAGRRRGASARSGPRGDGDARGASVLRQGRDRSPRQRRREGDKDAGMTAPISNVLTTAEGGNLAGIFQRWVGTDRIVYYDLTNGDIESPNVVTYDDFAERCARIAGGLLAFSAGSAPGGGADPPQNVRGKRVGILADNSVDYAASYMGIAWAGMATVPLNTRQPAATLEWIAEDAELALVIHDDTNADRLP
ncbi:MAG: AMP-binding protein, partial [Rhizobiales bacterium]|nr:AMP-binding protein [Hyphomicrobiales bacterium]